MKIAIDISQIVYGTGVSHYRENLVRNLLRIDKDNDYILYAGALRRKKDILNFFPQAKVFPIPPRVADILWNKLHVFPIENLIGECDIVHTSDWAEPPSKITKVTTVHDLIPIKFARVTPKIIYSTHKDRLRWVRRESKLIIVPSVNTKEDLIQYGVDERIIRVIPEAPNLKKASHGEVVATRRKFGIHDDYVIAIGTKPWKNLEKIICAFHLSKFGKNLKLIIVGERRGTDIKEERGVRFTGHVSDDELSALLTGSRALVFASLYEGFGIPILDGFSCEVPVVTSNVSSMTEVAQDAAILVDPHDIGSIAEGIETALRGPKSYIEKGVRRVKEFSWERTAQMTLEVYKEALE